MSKAYQLKVFQVASGDLWAGAEAQLFTLARALHVRPDTSVSVVLLNYGRLEQVLKNTGINVIVLDESELNGLQILRQLVHIIREQKPDIVHTHRLKENVLGSIAAFINGKTASLRTVHGAPEHQPTWWKLPKRMLYVLDRFCGRYLQQRIIAVSNNLAEILRKSYPVEKVRVIENGINLDAITHYPTRQYPDPDSSALGFRVGFAGRLVPIKRLDLFIGVARYFHDHHPDLDISFYIYGDGPLRKQLESLSSDMDTGDRIHFEGHCDNMHKKLQELDALLITSDHEGLPMVLLEAMMLQTPIIAHAVGGIPELLDQGSCGLLVKDHNSSGYAQAILNLMEDPGKCSEITRNALQRVKCLYSNKQNAHAYYSEYLTIISA